MSGTAQQSEIVGVGLYAEFLAGLIRQAPRDISREQVRRWLDDQSSLQRVLRSALMPSEVTDEDFFTITDDGQKKTSELIKDLRDLGVKVDVYREEHLDTDFPAPKKATTRRFKKTVEADPELAGKSADDCDDLGIPGITLRERLIMERMYFQETGKHLDPEAWTICSGSRCPDGNVPCVCWDPGGRRLLVGWHNPGYRHSGGRVRSAQP